MANSNSDIDFIKLIRANPILYDKGLARGVENGMRKDQAWRRVSEQLNASERACITRWKSLRDRFGKEYRRVLEYPEEPVTWQLFPHLMFLKDHYKHGSAKDELPDIKYKLKNSKRRRSNRDIVIEKECKNEIESYIGDHNMNQRLIQLVKDHDVIYDKVKIRDSKNLTAKNDAWRDISERMGISEEMCYKRWKELRERFARECRKYHIDPERPVEWEYFNDLLFLESHYRKGVPLDLNNIKRCGRPRKSRVNSNFKTDLNTNSCESHSKNENMDYISTEADHFTNQDESQDFSHMKEATCFDCTEPYVEESNIDEEQPLSETLPQDSQIMIVEEEQPAEQTEEQPVEQLCAIIDNIEAVLQQSQVCLKSLRNQQQRHQEELINATNFCSSDQPLIIQKMHVLLDGLSVQNRIKAEKKIVTFLCECQIKSINNEEVDDITDSHIKY